MNDIYELLKELKLRGGKLYTENNKLKLDIKPEALTPEIADKIKFYRQDILKLLSKTSKYTLSRIEQVAQQESYALSDAQRRLWVINQFEESSVAYNMPGNMYLDSNVDITYFKKALKSVVDRHEIMRTIFKADESGEVRQWVLSREAIGFEIDYFDLRTESNKQEIIERHLSEDAAKRFNLEEGPLFTATLLQVEDSDYIFYYNMHHIISDGWSLNVFFKDLRAFYDAYKNNEAPRLNDLRIQYKDYSAWQLAELEKEAFNEDKNYWLDKLGGELPLLDLPTDKQRPRVKTYKGQNVKDSIISPSVTRKLKDYAEKNGGSLFHGLFAAWHVLMARYTQQHDIVIGTPISGREHVDMKEQIGFYVNTLAIRNKVEPDDSFHSFFLRVRESIMEAYEHQFYPFNRLVEELNFTRDAGRSPVFDLLLVYSDESEEEGVDQRTGDFDGISYLDFNPSKFDLEFGFKDFNGEYVSLWGIFNPDVYDLEIAEGLVKHFKLLLRQLVENPEAKITEIDFLDDAEKQEQLVAFNDSTVDFPDTQTIAGIFKEQVQLTPDNVALAFEEKEFTYAELDALSNQLAHCLRNEHGISTEDLVGVQLERSEWLIIAILGILKAGAAYVPIDPDYPSSRKEFIVTDTQVKLLLTEANFVFDIDYYEGAVFAIDVEFEASDYSTDELESSTTANNLAYVMYTSGSTGKPKGVMVEHKSVLRLVRNTNVHDFSETDKLLSTGASSFDATTFEYWGLLLNGGTLFLCPQKTLLDEGLLKAEIQKRGVNIMWFTIGWLNQLIDSDLTLFENLKKIWTGGEKLSPDHMQRLTDAHSNLQVISCYGPTENTTFSTIYPITEVDGDIPLGQPISNTKAYILDEQNQLLPIGVVGEVCLSGEGLSRGYLNRPDLTNEKFIPHPFIEGERLYKTGDLGKWLPDGNMAFVGRKDDQVKIRGFRIELGEIEVALKQNAEIDNAVVIVSINENGEKEIVAYLTSGIPQNTSDLRADLAKYLPEYMVPAHFVQLEELPLNANGKIDKKALPNPYGAQLGSGSVYVAPKNEMENKLVTIWTEVLNKEKVGVKDDFFELGGHSIAAMKVMSKIQEEFDVRLNLIELFNHPTVSSLSGYLDSLNLIDNQETVVHDEEDELLF